MTKAFSFVITSSWGSVSGSQGEAHGSLSALLGSDRAPSPFPFLFPLGTPYSLLSETLAFTCHISSAKGRQCCCLVAKLCLTLAIPWTVAHQVTLSMGFPRQEYWSGLPFPSPGDLPDQGVEPEYWQFNTAGKFFTTDPPRYSEKERTHRNVSLILLLPASAVSALWRPKFF